MKTDTVFRLAREDELKVVQDLNHKLFVHDNEHFCDLNLQWPYEAEGENYFKNMIDGTRGVCFVAEVDGRVVGYLAGRTFDAGKAYLAKRSEIDNMFVEEHSRNAGAGAALVQEFKNGLNRMELKKCL